MSRIANTPVLLGFEDIEPMLDRIGKGSGDGYPPYNIERIRGTKTQGDVIRIVLAVAGFTRDQLEVTVAALRRGRSSAALCWRMGSPYGRPSWTTVSWSSS
jgi:HSP20 family molecular chaperone IbpA